MEGGNVDAGDGEGAGTNAGGNTDGNVAPVTPTQQQQQHQQPRYPPTGGGPGTNDENTTGGGGETEQQEESDLSDSASGGSSDADGDSSSGSGESTNSERSPPSPAQALKDAIDKAHALLTDVEKKEKTQREEREKLEQDQLAVAAERAALQKQLADLAEQRNAQRSAQLSEKDRKRAARKERKAAKEALDRKRTADQEAQAANNVNEQLLALLQNGGSPAEIKEFLAKHAPDTPQQRGGGGDDEDTRWLHGDGIGDRTMSELKPKRGSLLGAGETYMETTLKREDKKEVDSIVRSLTPKDLASRTPLGKARFVVALLGGRVHGASKLRDYKTREVLDSIESFLSSEPGLDTLEAKLTRLPLWVIDLYPAQFAKSFEAGCLVYEAVATAFDNKARLVADTNPKQWTTLTLEQVLVRFWFHTDHLPSTDDLKEDAFSEGINAIMQHPKHKETLRQLLGGTAPTLESLFAAAARARTRSNISHFQELVVAKYFATEQPQPKQQQQQQQATKKQTGVGAGAVGAPQAQPTNPTPGQGTQQAPVGWRPLRCYNCNEVGHFSRACPKPNPRHPPPEAQQREMTSTQTSVKKQTSEQATSDSFAQRRQGGGGGDAPLVAAAAAARPRFNFDSVSAFLGGRSTGVAAVKVPAPVTRTGNGVLVMDNLTDDSRVFVREIREEKSEASVRALVAADRAEDEEEATAAVQVAHDKETAWALVAAEEAEAQEAAAEAARVERDGAVARAEQEAWNAEPVAAPKHENVDTGPLYTQAELDAVQASLKARRDDQEREDEADYAHRNKKYFHVRGDVQQGEAPAKTTTTTTTPPVKTTKKRRKQGAKQRQRDDDDDRHIDEATARDKAKVLALRPGEKELLPARVAALRREATADARRSRAWHGTGPRTPSSTSTTFVGAVAKLNAALEAAWAEEAREELEATLVAAAKRPEAAEARRLAPVAVEVRLPDDSIVNALFDTGSPVSFIQSGVARSADIGFVKCEGDLPLVSLSGDAIMVLGMAEFTVDVRGETLPLKAYVIQNLDSFPAVVIGMDDVRRAGGATITVGADGNDAVAFTTAGAAAPGAISVAAVAAAHGDEKDIGPFERDPVTAADPVARFDEEIAPALRDACSDDLKSVRAGALVEEFVEGVRGIMVEANFDLFGARRTDGSRFSLPCKWEPVEFELKPEVDPARTIGTPRPLGRTSAADWTHLNDTAAQDIMDGRARVATGSHGAQTFVLRRDGKVRNITDHRGANKCVRPVAVAVPNSLDQVDRLVSKLASAPHSYMTCMDLMQAFRQMRLGPKTSKLLAYQCGRRLLEPTVGDFGSAPMPKLFQHMVNEVCEGTGAEAYADDVSAVATGATKEEALEATVSTTLTLLKRFAANHNSIRIDKLKVGAVETTLLGYHVSRHGRAPCPTRVRRIAAMPRPSTRKELERALGTFLFVSKHYCTPQFAESEAKLRDMTKNLAARAKLDWSEDTSRAWEHLVHGLDQAFIRLAPLDPSKRVTLVTDAASSTGVVGWVVYQDNADGTVNIVDAGSKRLTLAKRKRVARLQGLWDEFGRLAIELNAAEAVAMGAPQAELEGLLAAAEACQHIFHAVPGVTAVLDNASMVFFANGASGKGTRDAANIRLINKLADFGVSVVEHAPGTDPRVRVADFLSRLRCFDVIRNGVWARGGDEPLDDEWNAASYDEALAEVAAGEGAKEEEENRIHVSPVLVAPVYLAADDARRESDEDKEERQEALRARLVNDQAADPYVEALFDGDFDDLAPERDGDDLVTVLHKGRRVAYAPPGWRRLAARSGHDDIFAGHRSYAVTTPLVEQYWYWGSMATDLRKYCEGCDTCQRARVAQRRKGVNMRPAPPVNDTVQLDTLRVSVGDGGRPHLALVAVDECSGFVMTEALDLDPVSGEPRLTAEATWEALTRIFGDAEWPQQFVLDNGHEFQDVFKSNCEQLDIVLDYSAPHDPAGHGLVERVNRMLTEQVGKHVASEQYDASRDFDRNKPATDREREVWRVNDLLMFAESAINHSPSSARGGLCPVEIWSGHRPQARDLEIDVGIAQEEDTRSKAEREPGRLVNEARARAALDASRERVKEHYDEARRAREVTFKVGDNVYLRGTGNEKSKAMRIGARWNGQYRVAAVHEGDKTVELRVGPVARPYIMTKVSVRNIALAKPASTLPPVDEELERLASVPRLAKAEPPTGRAQLRAVVRRAKAYMQEA